MQKQLLIFLGPPGSGKGSLSQLCSKRLGWQQLSTGNLCRQHITNKTKIGEMIDFAIKSGKLISDSLIISMVDSWLRENGQKYQNIILDGFPRTLEQAAALRELLAMPDFAGITLKLIKIGVSDEIVHARLSGRAICQSNSCQVVYSIHEDSVLRPTKEMVCDACASPLIRRQDDNSEAIRERLQLYYAHETTLINYYKQVGESIIEINGEQQLEAVYSEFVGQAGAQIS